MDEYIKRATVTNHLDACMDTLWKPEIVALKCFVEVIPAADVAPVRHGEWLLRHEGHGHYWECSVCHTNPCIYVTKDTKFCPNCGAKMDGAE